MCDDCVTETEYRTRAGIVPPTIEALQAFLDEYADAKAFAVEYADEDGDHERLVAELTVIEWTVQRPAAAIALECTPFLPAEDEWTVRFDSIDLVTALETPEDVVPGRTEEIRTNPAAYLDLARVAPGAIDVGDLVTMLQAADYDGRDLGLVPLRSAANVKPEACTMALPLLRDLLAEGHHETKILEIMAAIAEECPSEIAPIVGEATVYLSSDDPERRAAAADCVSGVAAHDPSDVVDAVPALSSIVDDRDEALDESLFALDLIAAEYPGEVRPAAATLADALADPSLSVTDRLNATAALGRVASEYPDAGLDAVDDLCDLLQADDNRLRANAAGVLSDVAIVHGGALVSHVDELAPLLESDDDYTLVNASAGLGRVADVDPEAVRPLADRFVELLDHEHELVRENACWALGYLNAESALERLEAVRLDDDTERVRNIAAWAIAEIEGWA